MVVDRLTYKVGLKLLSKSINTIMSSNSLRDFFHSVGAATAQLGIPMHLFGLVEDTERRLPHFCFCKLQISFIYYNKMEFTEELLSVLCF